MIIYYHKAHHGTSSAETLEKATVPQWSEAARLF